MTTSPIEPARPARWPRCHQAAAAVAHEIFAAPGGIRHIQTAVG